MCYEPAETVLLTICGAEHIFELPFCPHHYYQWETWWLGAASTPACPDEYCDDPVALWDVVNPDAMTVHHAVRLSQRLGKYLPVGINT